MRIILFFILPVVLGGCIAAQNSTLVDSRVYQLEQEQFVVKRDIDYLKNSVESKEQALRADFAVLKAEFNALREEVQSLRGELEAAVHLLEKQKAAATNAEKERQEQMTALGRSLIERVAAIEHYLGLEAPVPGAAAGEAAADRAESAAEGNLAVERLYEMARQHYEQGNYDAARKGFEDLIARFPKSDLADNARFWIGESYFREKWYEKAILEYQKAIDDYPGGNKVPAALLKQGIAFSFIGKTAEARVVLNKLVKQFPGSSDAKIAEQKLAEL
ncbi:MAG: tol-pal system protein YbgF [Thermodesulfobacteriota bacterium]|nr:tol-pal system protein YbgF [Thermodesulfobacteriota bacterium]